MSPIRCRPVVRPPSIASINNATSNRSSCWLLSACATCFARHSKRFLLTPLFRPLPLAVWVPLALAAWCMPMAHAAGPVPQGGAFVRGQGAISGSTTSLTINQSSSRGVIDWHSFSIGNGNTVAFNNGSGATLNRVMGGDQSSILGSLTATGSLYLINPQGVVIGSTGVITTGGRFVASTLGTCPDAFMNGGPLTLSGTSNASVVNFGHIGSTGGDVFLIARRSVENYGVIEAPNGSAELAAGQQVLLQDSSSSKQVFVQVGSGGTVLEAGQTSAAQVSLQAADGNVYALASHTVAVRATGTATRDGHVWLVADQGNVNLLGAIGAVNADGQGGTVETSGANVSFGTVGFGLPVVLAGLWKVSAPSFTIGPATAGAFTRSLNRGTSIDVATNGTTAPDGDLNVSSSVNWQGGASLSLAAYGNLTIAPNATLSNTGSGNLTLRADASGIDNGGSVANRGTIDWSGSTGVVSALYDMNGSYSAGNILSNSAWSAAPYSGLLTQVTAYKLVNSLTDLQNMSLDLAGIYALGKDIDASATVPDLGVAFISIGSAAAPFSGQFDGRGHVIDQFSQREMVPDITTPARTRALGLFGVIGSTGVVRNVGMTNSDLRGEGDVPNGTLIAYGILAGENQGLITYAFTTGSRSSPHYGGVTLGGLVGRNDGLIERSWSSAFVGDAGVIGGLVGTNAGTIDQSYASGAVSGGVFGSPGGLVGFNSGTISQSYAAGDTFGLFAAGGLVYANFGVIEQSFVSGTVRAPSFQGPDYGTYGGIAAYNNAGAIGADVYWDKETTTRTIGAGNGVPLLPSNGLTTVQMSTPSSFASWDFSSTGPWALAAGATHPILRWQLAQ